ncbi:SpoIIE family protein phosphatase [Mycobacterium sp. 852002-51057_SCH5723018]|uniref:SpoIIE family protein phosphatase n=1 Tax=Mycobacterium sp. 852002-51057_SCH5723018 TaxID=1834094 RepID=UPI0008017681|nr:SpoIIE family protein phosphatase [Mycobacterium sp. 852002-51057_SCH5723018]OBG28901.1 histidine kinase [Mycobacterium sp. 852002-51057_SCH5723018]
MNPLPADLAAAATLGGDTGRRFAEFDWDAHPLGSVQTWPGEVRSAVATTLTSRFPIVIWLGPDNLFLIYNDAYAQILGDKHPAALGRPAEQVWWEIWEQIHPMLTSVLTTGAATWSDDLMLPLVTGDQPEERYFTFSYSPIIAGDGRISGVFCAVNETTERVLGERRLHLLNTVATAMMETRSIDDAVRVAVTVCAGQPADLPFIAVYVGELRGATPSVLPLLPSDLAELTDWGATPRSRAQARLIDGVGAAIPGIEQALAGDCPRQALVLPLGEAATAGALVVGISPRRPLDEQYRGFCQLLADQLSSALASVVSYEQQRERADALAELDRAKTAFLTNVSHEFRTPLALLLGPLEDALSEVPPGSAQADRLTTAARNARRLQRLVDSLLDFSRIEAGRANAKLVCTDVGALTAHIALSFTELCQRAGLDLVVDCGPVLADVDPGMWETIVLNLLSNAVKYTLRGSISVQVREEPEHCRLTLRDTGVGIAADDLDRLFERFYRADNMRGRSVEGTGIGLSLVRGLVELQRGTVEIDSELDRGTTVTIRLPRSVGAAAADRSPAGLLDETNPYVAEASQWLTSVSEPAAVTTEYSGPRQLVLIADDNADMRAHLERVLSAHWETVLVADGESALAATKKLRPDAIVTDVMMPGLGGFELVAAIRADPELAATPVLMLSARAGAEAVDEGFAGGADDYLPKPFRSQELVDRVASRLSAITRARHRQRRETQLDLMQLDSALQAADSIAGILDALLDSPFASGGAAAVTIGALEGEHHVRFQYAGDLPAEVRDRYHVSALDSPLIGADVIASGKPMIVSDTFELPPRYEHAVRDTADSVRACVAHPLRDNAGRVVGALLLLWSAPRRFEAAELDTFGRIAELTQSALDRIRVVARERRIAVDFQEHLLDLDRGSTAAVVAAVYQPAGEAMRVGGDWYSVTPLGGEGRIGISVGDVVGHGLAAAIVMSRLRAAVAASALTVAQPGAVLGALDRYAASVTGARCATVAYAVVDTGTTGAGGGGATVSYSCAGHPYPLLIPPDGDPVFLESGRRAPVGVHENGAADATATAELPAGGLVLLYTDGLIERAGETLDDGFSRLKVAAADCAELPVDSVCAELLVRMTPPEGYRDDVVVLALRPGHATARSFATVLPAAPAQVPVARAQLRNWLQAIAIDPLRQEDILLATGEAVTNAIEHGSGSEPRKTVSVEAFLRSETVAVTVSDTGRWVGDSSDSLRNRRRGRGLSLIGGLADRVDTARTPGGTRVTLQFDHAVATVRRRV